MAIKTLAKLGQRLPEFCRRAYLGEVDCGEWAELSNVLQQAALSCREQVAIDTRTWGTRASIEPRRGWRVEIVSNRAS